MTLRRNRGFMLAVLLGATALGTVPQLAPAAIDGSAARRQFVPGEVVVRFRPGVAAQTKAALLREVDATSAHSLSIPGAKLVRLDAGESVPATVASLEAEPQVLYAEPNFIYRAAAPPDDPRFPELWGLENTGQLVGGAFGTLDGDIDALQAWETTTGDSSVIVAVADTGVAYDHPELEPNVVLPGWDFVDDDGDPRDFDGHGTHVAGTIGAKGDNGEGIVGVDWEVGLLPVRVLDGEGDGTNEEIAEGFAFAGAQGAKVVNASLSGSGFSQLILEAIEGAPNTLFVVAAGNEGEDNDVAPRYPCNYTAPNVVCVAAVNQGDVLAGFSDYGATSVDLAAPGTNVLSTMPAYGEPAFSEDFEEPIDSTWTTGGTNDTWARTEEAASGGGWSLADSPGGDYADETNSFARNTAPFSLAGQSGCRLEYALELESEFGFDELLVEASTEVGGLWTVLAEWSGWTEGEFVTLDHDLSAFDGAGEVFIRFHFQSDELINEDGAHIDDVAVRCLTSTYAGDEFRLLQGTSMATPHVAGAAALLLAEEPGLSASALKSRLLASVDVQPSLACTTVSGGRLNAATALSPPLTPPVKPSCQSPTEPPGPTTDTGTEPTKRVAAAACAAAKRSLARAKRRLSRARRQLRRAEGDQRPQARRGLARAKRRLANARKRKRRACRPRLVQA